MICMRHYFIVECYPSFCLTFKCLSLSLSIFSVPSLTRSFICDISLKGQCVCVQKHKSFYWNTVSFASFFGINFQINVTCYNIDGSFTHRKTLTRSLTRNSLLGKRTDQIQTESKRTALCIAYKLCTVSLKLWSLI